MRRRFMILGRKRDLVAPSVSTFTATTPSNSTTVAITAFTASEGGASFLITENSTPPAAGAAGWSGSAPTTFAVSGSTGSYTLYPWVKDAAGNVSSVYGSPVTVLVIVAALWLDGSVVTGLYQTNDTSTPVSADGQDVGYITDKSGNGCHATQGTAGARATWKANIKNGLGVIRFSYPTDFFTLSGTLNIGNNVTALAVFKTTDANTRQTLLGQQNTAGGFQLEFDAGVPSNPCFGVVIPGKFVSYASVGGTANTFYINSYRRNGAGDNHAIRQNGVAKTLDTVTVDPTAGFTGNGTKEIGTRNSGTASQMFAGDLAELIIINATISDAAWTAVETYLNNKWAAY